jgi:YbbR domain-containing protein
VKRPISIWPFRHIGLKAISVAVAMLLWMVVSGEEPVERGLRVPLELQQMPASLELQSELPALVDVRVRGGATTLSRIATGDIVAVIDVHTARPGPRLFQLTPDQVRAPFGVHVLQVSPASVAMAFENTASKEVRVVPSVEGTPAPGFVVVKTTTDPQTVQVTGPESAVRNVTQATTEPVSVAGAREAVIDRVTVGFVDPTLRLTNAKANATVRVDIAPASAPEKPERGRARRGGDRQP